MKNYENVILNEEKLNYLDDFKKEMNMWLRLNKGDEIYFQIRILCKMIDTI